MTALILMYHDLAESVVGVDPGHRPYVLAPEVFRRQMDLAAACGMESMTVREWCATTTPGRALVITFDDGQVSNYDMALPILARCGLKATFFVTAGRIGTGQTMNWQQLRALHKAGMEVGSHTLTHRPPSTLNDRELRHELLESRRILEDGLRAAVTSISSPTGFFNPRMSDMAREVGYRALCFGRVGLAADGSDRFALKRVAIKRGTSERRFKALLRFKRAPLAYLRLQQQGRDFARGILGPSGYTRLRKSIMGPLS